MVPPTRSDLLKVLLSLSVGEVNRPIESTGPRRHYSFVYRSHRSYTLARERGQLVVHLIDKLR